VSFTHICLCSHKLLILLLTLLLLAIAENHHSAEHYEQVVKQRRVILRTGITLTLLPYLTLRYACPVFSYQGNLCLWHVIAFETCFGIVKGKMFLLQA
jgi:hypothetical protein